ALRFGAGSSPWSAEASGQFPGDRKPQAASQARERMRRPAGLRHPIHAAVERATELLDQPRKARLVGAQPSDFLAAAADFGGDPGKHLPTLAALLDDALALGGAGARVGG